MTIWYNEEHCNCGSYKMSIGILSENGFQIGPADKDLFPVTEDNLRNLGWICIGDFD